MCVCSDPPVRFVYQFVYNPGESGVIQMTANVPLLQHSNIGLPGWVVNIGGVSMPIVHATSFLSGVLVITMVDDIPAGSEVQVVVPDLDSVIVGAAGELVVGAGYFTIAGPG